MKHLKVLGVLTVVLAAVPAMSYAELAYPSIDVNLRAGPAIEYPVVARLAAGVEISVQGCIEDYRWCDVVAGPYRGWVYSGNIVYPYQGSNVPVLTYGAAIGIGVLAFSLAHYWDDHYRARPWYPQRQRWIDRPPPRYYAPPYRPSPPRPDFRRDNDRPRPQAPSPQAPSFRSSAPVTAPQGPGLRSGGDRPPPQGPGFRQGGDRPPAQGPGARAGDNQPAPQGRGPGGGQRPPRERGPDNK